MNKPSNKTIERLSFYRRILHEEQEKGKEYIFSHVLAALANIKPAQVRRDLMILEHGGSPQKGYKISVLLDEIGRMLDPEKVQHVCLVGIGNLGRAVLAYFTYRRPKLKIVAAFDSDPSKVDRVVAGCRSFHISELKRVVQEKGISVGIITVPGSEAQNMADVLVGAGIKGIVNFAPVSLRVSPDVFLENLDITMAVEKTAYFARQKRR